MKIGSVGTLSGPLGGVVAPVVGALQVWVRHVNSQGGVEGHPVELTVGDDGGDPARNRALTQQLVEKDKVLAFLANTGVFTGSASIAYLEQKRIPVIGYEGAGPYGYTSPMMFPQMSSAETNFFFSGFSAARRGLAAGKKKFGSIICSESEFCAVADRTVAYAAASAGAEIVYRGRSSLAQPDYTAECLAARSSGVETLLVFLDVSSVSRVASACARQNYRPTFATTGTLASPKQVEDPNLKDFVAATATFPWFQGGTPQTDEFNAAMKRFGGLSFIGGAASTGWVAAKLFERAAVSMPEPPTTEALLNQLWTLRNDTLGGTTKPLTFTKDKPTDRNPICWFDVAIDANAKAWKSPDNYRVQCETVDVSKLG